MKKTFRTTIVRDGSMCFIPVPFDPHAVFGKVRVPVKVTLKGFTYRSTIATMGEGPCIPLRRSNREAAGLEGDETLQVTLELEEPREVEPPVDFVRALKAHELAWDRWGELSFSHQREHVEAIEQAKKPETRARRIEAAVAAIAARPSKSKPRAETTRYALLLRGVNVGTKNSLPMAELRSMLTKLGCTDVQTYVQSGNAVFATRLSEAALTKGIEQALEGFMGRPIATTLRTREQLEALVDGHPFTQQAINPSHLCVTFLSHAPTEAELAPLRAQDWTPDAFEVAGREIYTRYPNGQGKSALAAALNKLRVRGALTTRNWNTVTKLLEMLGD